MGKKALRATDKTQNAERKKTESEAKKLTKAEEKEPKLKEKELKKKIYSLRRKHASSDSESDDHFSVNNRSDIDLDVSNNNCFICELENDDQSPLDWVACSSCPRLFHKRCTDISFDATTPDETADFPFECLFC